MGRPKVDEEIKRLVVRMAKENPRWGHDRIVGAFPNLGHPLSEQTVGNILRRHGRSLAPKCRLRGAFRSGVLALAGKETLPSALRPDVRIQHALNQC